MPMTISSMVNSVLLNSVNQSSSVQSSSNDPIAKGLKVAGTRIEQQLSSTNVQISAFGQIKSGFASLQTAGNALSSMSKTATADEVKKSAQAFVDAYNATNKAISTSTSTTTGASGSLATNGRAIIAGNDLRNVVSSGSTTADLKSMGITMGKDGTLSLDAKIFDAAAKGDLSTVKGTLTSLGAKAAQVATKELEGNVATGLQTLETRAKNLTSQQTAYTNAASSLFSSQQQYSGLGNNATSAISAYMNMFSS